MDNDELVTFLEHRERTLAWRSLEQRARDEIPECAADAGLPAWWERLLALVAMLVLGGGTAVVALIFNYVLFVMLLHMDFS